MTERQARAFTAAVNDAEYLDLDTEITLFGRWKRDNDAAALQRIIIAHARMVPAIARRLPTKTLDETVRQELLQIGNDALVRAAHRFDPSRGWRFSTLAFNWIDKSMRAFVQNHAALIKRPRPPRRLRPIAATLPRRIREHERLTGRPWSDAQTAAFAREMDVAEADVAQVVRDVLERPRFVPLDPPDADDTAFDIPDDKPSPEEACCAAQERRLRSAALHQAIASLPDRERLILIARRLTEPPVPLQVLAEAHSVSRERIRQIEHRALRRLQEMIDDRD